MPSDPEDRPPDSPAGRADVPARRIAGARMPTTPARVSSMLAGNKREQERLRCEVMQIRGCCA